MPRLIKTVIVAFLLTLPLLIGCKGTETRENVDDTVETLAGKKQVDQMKKMEKDLGNIADQQTDKFDQLDKEVSED